MEFKKLRSAFNGENRAQLHVTHSSQKNEVFNFIHANSNLHLSTNI